MALPKLHFIVQDFPSMQAEAVSTIPPELRDRVRFMPHSFFEDQPVKDAEIYLLRHVLHDWPDSECLQILRALVPAMNPGDNIFVCDKVLPSARAGGEHQEKIARFATVSSRSPEMQLTPLTGLSIFKCSLNSARRRG